MTNSHNSGYFPGNTGLVSGTGDAVTLGAGLSFSGSTLSATAAATGKTLKLSNKGSIRRFGGGGFTSNTSTPSQPGYTFANTMQLPGSFRFTRIGFYNPTTSPKAIGSTILIGANATAANFYSPDTGGYTGISGGFQGMKQVFFDQGGASSANVIQSPSAVIPGYQGTVTSLTVPAMTVAGSNSAYVPTQQGFQRVTTDWAYTPSLPRTDGGSGFLLSTIVDVPASLPSVVPCIAMDATASGNTAYSAAGITYKQGFVAGSMSGNLPSLNNSLTSGSGSYGQDVVHVVEAIFDNPALTIGWIGDSISDLPDYRGAITGRPTVIELCSQAMTTAKMPVCAHNLSWFGQDLRTYAQHASAELPNVQHMGACVIQAWSGNDPYDADPNGWAGLMAGFAQGLAEILMRQGCYVILATPAQIGTRFGTASGYQNLWVQCDARIRTLGLPILDLGALWGQPGSPWLFKSGYDVGDGLHPGTNAVALAATALQNILTPLLPS